MLVQNMFVFRILVCFVVFHTTFSEARIQPWGRVLNNEYCDFETFQTECRKDEVVIITSAEYGHMQLGKCIKVDLGFLGCKRDVINIIDSKCSGRRSCEMLVNDESLRETQPCTPGIAVYLDVSYTCVREVPNICQSIEATSEMTYISSTQVFNENCNGRTAVRVQASAGQEIAVTLISLGAERERETYGLIVDDDGAQQEVALTSSGDTVTDLETMRSHQVSVILDSNFQRSKFLIGFKAVGCQTIPPPPNTVFERNGDTATVSCIDSQQSWQLLCRGVHWVGVIGNCTTGVAAAAVMQEVQGDSEDSEWNLALSKEMIFLITGCATLLSAVLIVTAGYVCLKRTQVESQARCASLNRRYSTNTRTVLVKPRPDSDYLLPLYPSETKHDIPLPTIPPPEPTQPQSSVKKNNDDDYSTTSPDYSRKYFVLDKDYMALNNFASNV